MENPKHIRMFAGHYHFLSNFYPSPIVIDGVFAAPTVEHGYQAWKAIRMEDAVSILKCKSPGQTKRVARSIEHRPDWDEVKLSVMEYMLSLKFARNSVLGARLIATGDAYLTEGNTWGDCFWGVCNGVGENHLGRLLMERRAFLNHQIQAWNIAVDHSVVSYMKE